MLPGNNWRMAACQRAEAAPSCPRRLANDWTAPHPLKIVVQFMLQAAQSRLAVRREMPRDLLNSSDLGFHEPLGLRQSELPVGDGPVLPAGQAPEPGPPEGSRGPEADFPSG